MRLTVVGCSGSVPGPESAASCYLVEVDGFRALLDLGSGALGPLHRYCPPTAVDAVLVSHLHADHCIDLLALYVARTYGPAGRCPPIPVLAPDGAGEHLARAYGRADAPGLAGCFDFVPWNGRHEVGPLTVTVTRMAHPVPAFAMRLEHGGRSLVYSGDTGPTDALVDIARDADLALFEASFQAGRDDAAPADLHLTAGEAGTYARRAGVRRLVITHLPPWNVAATSRAAAGEAFDGPVEMARPGATYDV